MFLFAVVESAHAALPDFEPDYTHTPRYLILEFGSKAKSQICFVLDGDNILYADCDGDGVSPFGGDCDDGNGDAYGRPGTIESLIFNDKNNASWQPPTDTGGTVAGLSYDTIESADASDFLTGATCVESADTDTTAFLSGTPGSGSVSYYVIRASNACDIGPAGFDSTGLERPARVCP